MAKQGKIIDIRDVNGDIPVVQEGESCDVIAQLKQGTVDVPKSNLLSLSATLYDENTQTVINSRYVQDIFDNNDGELSVDGQLTLRLQPTDNVVVNTFAKAKQLEYHILRFVWTWNDGSSTRTGKQEIRYPVEKQVDVEIPN